MITRLEACLDRVKSWNLLGDMILEGIARAPGAAPPFTEGEEPAPPAEETTTPKDIGQQAAETLREQQKTVLSQLQFLKTLLKKCVDVQTPREFKSMESVPQELLHSAVRRFQYLRDGQLRVRARERAVVVGNTWIFKFARSIRARVPYHGCTCARGAVSRGAPSPLRARANHLPRSARAKVPQKGRK